jgi:hypothetical protein
VHLNRIKTVTTYPDYLTVMDPGLRRDDGGFEHALYFQL